MKKYRNWEVSKTYEMIRRSYICGSPGLLIQLKEIKEDEEGEVFGIFTKLNQPQLCQECIDNGNGCGGNAWGDWEIEDENFFQIPGAWPLLGTPRECNFKRVFLHPRLPTLRFLL